MQQGNRSADQNRRIPGLKTVLHYMDVVAEPLCRKPFAPVAEQFLPELKALAQQLQQEKAQLG
jgi:N-acetylneuraminate lyase